MKTDENLCVVLTKDSNASLALGRCGSERHDAVSGQSFACLIDDGGASRGKQIADECMTVFGMGLVTDISCLD